MKTLFSLLLLAFAAFLPAQAAAQAHLSTDPKLRAARVLVLNQRFDEALRLLRSVPTDHPDKVDVLFLVGLAALGAAEAREDAGEREILLDGAVAALRLILIDRPELMRVRLELARAFFLKREDELAERHFQQALAGRPPPSVVINIQRFLRIIRERRRWRGQFGLSVAPDSNLNSASDARTVWLDTPFGRLPFQRGGDIDPKSGVGLSVWGGGEYQHRLAERFRLRAGADAAVRDYKESVFDSHFLASHIGPLWLIDSETEASLLATVQRQWSGGQPSTDQFGLRLEGERRLSPRLSVFGRAGVRRRNCRDCNWLDGPVGEVSLGASWGALPVLRVGGNVGWSWSRTNAEYWRHDGPEASLGATVFLPRGFTLGARASMRWKDYQGEGFAHRTIDREPREDKTRTLSLSLHNRAITVFGFSPRLTLVNERLETNAQALDYERNRGELSFVRQF